MTPSEPRIRVFTDSTADLPAHLVAEHAIEVVPLLVTIDDQTFPDGTLSQAEFFARMNAAAELPRTSQPPVGAFIEAYGAALETVDHIVSVHISSKLSGTVEAARQAAAQFGDRVHVIDSRTLSFALGFQALAGARAVLAGAALPEVISTVERVREESHLYVGLDKLDNLAKGGRIGKVAAFLGGMLDLKVSLTVSDGSFVPIGRDRGSRAALDRTVRWVGERMEGRHRGRFCVLHAMAEDKAERLRSALTEAYDAVEMHVVETGSVIAAHTGTGWGVAFVPE